LFEASTDLILSLVQLRALVSMARTQLRDGGK